MKEYTEKATRIAKQAGVILNDGFQQKKEISHKNGRELLTNVDIESEEFIRSGLKYYKADWKILAEETSSDKEYTDGYCWIIDPLDGTNNFAHGFPFFCVSIALAKDGEIISGVIYEPLRNELFYADDDGAFLNNERISISNTEQLDEAFLATGFPYDRSQNNESNIQHFNNFYFEVLGIRRAGSAAIDLAYTSCGRFDGFWELKLKPWDMAAGSIIVEKAGGIVTDFSGNRWTLDSDRIISGNEALHKKMLQIIQGG